VRAQKSSPTSAPTVSFLLPSALGIRVSRGIIDYGSLMLSLSLSRFRGARGKTRDDKVKCRCRYCARLCLTADVVLRGWLARLLTDDEDEDEDEDRGGFAQARKKIKGKSASRRWRRSRGKDK